MLDGARPDRTTRPAPALSWRRHRQRQTVERAFDGAQDVGGDVSVAGGRV